MDFSASVATKDAARLWRRRSCTPPRFSSTLPSEINYRGNMDSCPSHGRGSPLKDRCLFPPKYVEGLVLPPDRYWNGMRTAIKSWCDALDGIPP
jgi:hypothetical protein